MPFGPERARAPRIHLFREGISLLVHGPGQHAEPLESEGTFRLPHLPLSLAQWCAALGRRFRRDRHRCLAVALMLDSSTRHWLTAIPTQRCHRRYVRWQPQAGLFPRLPRHVWLAGSYQTAVVRDVFAAADAVPALDGIHIIENFQQAQIVQSWIFLRFNGGEAMLADPADILVDDLDVAITQNAERLRCR